MTDRSIEEPADDVAEQSQDVLPDAEETEEPPDEIPLEVDEADAAEQSRVVNLDEDEYI
jgi:hypothetical protein